MKNIGLLISELNSGGAERVVSHLSHILSEDYNVHVILFEDTYLEYELGGKLDNLNVPAREGSVLVKVKLLFSRIRKLKKLIKQEKLDCVISFLDSPNFVNLFAKVKGCKKVISIRNYSELENRQTTLGKLTDIVMKRIYRRADCVVSVSKLIERDFIEHYNIPEEKICTVYNPYNFKDIIEKGSVPLTEKEQSFYDGNFTFINVGRIMYQKGIWHLVKAFKMVREEYSNARLVIVGEDLSDGRLVPLIEGLGIADSVLLTGRTKNPYQYMMNSQCYVLTSLFEGFPNALVEATACGCPVIATDCKSGPREILFESADLSAECNEVTVADYGIIVPNLESEENWDSTVLTENEKALARAMLEIVRDNDLRERLSVLAKKRSNDFSYDTCRRAFISVIEK